MVRRINFLEVFVLATGLDSCGRIVKQRLPRKAAGKYHVYFMSLEGMKLEAKSLLACYLYKNGEAFFKLEDSDFRAPPKNNTPSNYSYHTTGARRMLMFLTLKITKSPLESSCSQMHPVQVSSCREKTFCANKISEYKEKYGYPVGSESIFVGTGEKREHANADILKCNSEIDSSSSQDEQNLTFVVTFQEKTIQTQVERKKTSKYFSNKCNKGLVYPDRNCLKSRFQSQKL
ncbi:LOW QUALITY PROTEIN: methyl-CpG-binding domain protein 4-like [Sarcophilus harrisii]